MSCLDITSCLVACCGQMNNSHLPQLAQQQQLLVRATSATHLKNKRRFKNEKYRSSLMEQ